MKFINLLQLKSVWCALLVASLIITFFPWKYLRMEPSERSFEEAARPEPTEPLRVQVVGKGGNNFDRQCREFLYEMQGCMIPFPRSENKEELSADGQRKADRPRSIVQLRPLQKKIANKQQKKQGVALPEKSEKSARMDYSVVQLRPLRKKIANKQRKKQGVALQEKSMRMDYSGLLGGNEQAAYTKYTGSPGGLLPAVQTTVASLAARSILYGVGPLSDCSGIFHRVLMGVKERCPDYEYPAPERYRDSRELARWYHERGELILIRNASAQADLIRPGVALFYGHAGVVYKNPSIGTLLSPRRGIYHVGIVAQVYRDKAGKVTGYELFHGHGRRGRTKASITKSHQRKPTRAGYPPFGNGRQQLVAVARIVRPVEKGR